MTDHDTGGTLDGWDDELDGWTEAGECDCRACTDEGNRHRHGDSCGYADDDLEAQRITRDVCIRDRPLGAVCNQGYDHTGRCDWFNATYDRIVADAVAKAQS